MQGGPPGHVVVCAEVSYALGYGMGCSGITISALGRRQNRILNGRNLSLLDP